MTRIEFIINVENKFAQTAELCEKEVAKGRLITISSEDETHFSAIQMALWQVSVSSFLPLHHLQNTVDEADFSAICPIHFALCSHISTQNKLIQDDVLVHFHLEAPPIFSRFRYLVELVGVEESDKAAARLRYKFYRDRGYEIKTTNAMEN